MSKSSEMVFDQKALEKIFSPLPFKTPLSTVYGKKKVIVIAGPTAVGKTQLSLQLAKVLGGEIISADAIQVYQGMDIGTAKVAAEIRKEIPHHLIDIRAISESFNVVDFYQEAQHKIKEIIARNRVPIVVGGTGFYLHALIYGPPTAPASIPEIREQLENEMREKGVQCLYEKLKTLDPEYAKTVRSADGKKIIRALEIIAISDKKVSDFSRRAAEVSQTWDFLCWFVFMKKEFLYPRIEARCDWMVAQGFLDEVRMLLKEGIEENVSASRAIGYCQAIEFLKSPQTDSDWQLFISKFKQASRHYAKRQMTWFRKEPLFQWVDMSYAPLDEVAAIILQDYERHSAF